MAAADNAITPTERADPRLLEILVCPLTKGRLVYDEAAQELLSLTAGVAYPIRMGVPIMTAEEARHLSDEEVQAAKGK